MISCSEAVRQLWDFLEQDLADDDRSLVDEHLTRCRRCCGEAEFAAELRRVLASATGPRIPPDVEERLAGFLDDLEDQSR